MAVHHVPESGLFPEIEDRDFTESKELEKVATALLERHGGSGTLLQDLRQTVRDERIHVLYLLNAKPFDPLKDEMDHDAIAKAIKAPKLWHDVTGYDAVIWVRSYFWTLFEERRRNAVALHELLHLEISYDDAGQPKLKIAHHDIEEFKAVVRYYGPLDQERELFVKAFGMWEADGGQPGTSQEGEQQELTSSVIAAGRVEAKRAARRAAAAAEVGTGEACPMAGCSLPAEHNGDHAFLD